MNRSTLLVFAFAAAASFVGAAALPASMPTAQALQLSAEADKDVIVIMRDQVPSMPAARRAPCARSR